MTRRLADVSAGPTASEGERLTETPCYRYAGDAPRAPRLSLSLDCVHMTPSTTAPASRAPEMSSPAPLLYPDLEQELATTRRFLERYPDGRGSWRPHEKSMTLSHLATHLAGLPKFGTLVITADELDFAKSGPRSND